MLKTRPVSSDDSPLRERAAISVELSDRELGLAQLGLEALLLNLAPGRDLATAVADLLVRFGHAVRQAAMSAPAVPVGGTVGATSMRLSQREMKLLTLGLEELVQNQRSDRYLAATASDLLARLKLAAPVAAERAG
jgi:hypothetical protein